MQIMLVWVCLIIDLFVLMQDSHETVYIGGGGGGSKKKIKLKKKTHIFSEHKISVPIISFIFYTRIDLSYSNY